MKKDVNTVSEVQMIVEQDYPCYFPFLPQLHLASWKLLSQRCCRLETWQKQLFVKWTVKLKLQAHVGMEQS